MKFRKRIKIAPGVNLNLSNSGISGTFGPRGASVNVGKKGVHANLGVPGTGLYTRQRLSAGAEPENVPDNVGSHSRSRVSLLWLLVGFVVAIGVLSHLL